MSTYKAIYEAKSLLQNYEVTVDILLDRVIIYHENNKFFWLHQEIDHNCIVEDHICIIKHQDLPLRIIKINDSLFYNHLKKNIPDLKITNPNKVRNASSLILSIFALIIPILLMIGMAIYFYFPKLVEKSIGLISVETEIKIGNILYHQYISSVLKDSTTVDTSKTIIVNELYQQLKTNHTYPINITVIKSDEINAFALPGGNIIVYSSLLDKMKSYPELIALLGHESGHVMMRHTLKSVVNKFGIGFLITIILGDGGTFSNWLIGSSSEVSSLSYSRDLEHQADEYGYNVCQTNKIDPNGMINLFLILESATDKNSSSEYLQTHPVIENRIEFIKSLMKYKTIESKSNDNLDHLWEKIKL